MPFITRRDLLNVHKYNFRPNLKCHKILVLARFLLGHLMMCHIEALLTHAAFLFAFLWCSLTLTMCIIKLGDFINRDIKMLFEVYIVFIFHSLLLPIFLNHIFTKQRYH